MKIVLFTRSAKKLKNPTSGDYWKDRDGTINVAVQDLGDENYEFLIAIHSLIEGKLIEQNDINPKKYSSSKKHLNFQKRKNDSGANDPGDDPTAPYHKEHTFATFIEMQIAKELNLSWEKYTKK